MQVVPATDPTPLAETLPDRADKLVVPRDMGTMAHAAGPVGLGSDCHFPETFPAPVATCAANAPAAGRDFRNKFHARLVTLPCAKSSILMFWFHGGARVTLNVDKP
jgi:hypothetical protein